MGRIKSIGIVFIVLCVVVFAGCSVFAAELDDVTYNSDGTITVQGTCHGNQAQIAIFNSDNEPVYLATVEVTNGAFNSTLPATFAFQQGETCTVKAANYDGTEVSTSTFTVPVEYTVTFNANGGSTVASQTITSGTVATLPTAPAKTNYTFGGWYQDAALTTAFDFETLITANTTIYAKWNAITYTVSFNANGGSTVAGQTVTSGTAATFPTAPTKTNYTFGGWYADATLTTAFDFKTLITANTTIYAKWNAITYTVLFNANGGSTVASQTVTSGTAATLPTAPTKTNYTFGGWYQDATLATAFDFKTLITANTTIYAKWNEIPVEHTINPTEKIEDDITVEATGMFTGNPVLEVAETATGNSGYNSLITLVKSDEEVIGSYDISITRGDFVGDLTLTFTVGRQYDGETITVYHKLASGQVETKTAVVNNGKITITVDELSPFMLVANKSALAGKDTTPKTGNNIYLYAVTMVVAISGTFATSKLSKKRDSIK